MPIVSPTANAIHAAAEQLRDGGLIGLPTETVYGLGCDASNPDALAALYKAKGRPTNHPVIVHVASVEQLSDWAMDIPEVAHTLAKAFWPGPLTLILKKQPHVLDAITGGQDTVGIRIPSHPVALDLLRTFGGGITAPSANRFGRISPTTALHVMDEFGDHLTVLDGGPCAVGVESTIVDVSSGTPRILRPGMITAEAIQNSTPLQQTKIFTKHGPAVRVSGSLTKHYAPTTPTLLMARDDLHQAWNDLPYEEQGTLGLLLLTPLTHENGPAHVRVLGTHPTPYAAGFYATLRELDTKGLNALWIELPPNEPGWEAILDRLKRCAAL
ncbi:MAG: L-threonylcarbamoyladenylate synthase [Vampirovibrionales bacterium]|nr:L-threonylcarbamoyladenylate synthase [Vampirovibrionales bacterium]